MNVANMSAEEIREAGIEALTRELGPGGAVRFLQLFDVGRGDYSSERQALLPKVDVAELVKRVRAAKGRGSAP